MNESATIISISMGIMIGNYALFYKLVEQVFVTRYKKFHNDFKKWVEDDHKAFLDQLRSQINTIADPQKLIKFVDNWKIRHEIIEEFSQRRDSINNSMKYIYFFLFSSVIFSFLSMLNPSQINPAGAELPLYFTSFGWSTMFLAITIIVRFIFSVQGINELMTKYELGSSVKEIIEMEIEKKSRKKNS